VLLCLERGAPKTLSHWATRLTSEATSSLESVAVWLLPMWCWAAALEEGARQPAAEAQGLVSALVQAPG